MAAQALIIDKDLTFAERLESALREHGLEVETRATGREGIERAKAVHPDLIVLCVELDDTSGYSICAKIKKDADLKGVPLVITSEKATQETFDHHKKLKTRAQVYMMKPFEPNELIWQVNDLIDLKGQPVSSSSWGGSDPGPDPAGFEARDTDAFGDAGAELDEAIASLSDEPPPLPDELGADGAGGRLPPAYDEDDVRTTIGHLPDSSESAPSGGGPSQDVFPRSGGGSGDLSHHDILRRMKDAERARDEAIATERATQAQLKALSIGTSQIPAASSGSREVVGLKKELNAKEREVLQLRETLQERDRELLDARDREAELEEKVVQTEEARNQADRARVEAESQIAGAEARADELERSSKVAIEERDRQIEDADRRIEGLEKDLSDVRGEAQGLREDVSYRDQVIEERNATVQARDETIAGLEADLQQSRSEADGLREELAQARSDIEALEVRAAGLDSDLAEARAEIEALRGSLAETEDRLASALRRIREDADLRGKARQAIEITLNLLNEADYVTDADVDAVGLPVEEAGEPGESHRGNLAPGAYHTAD